MHALRCAALHCCELNCHVQAPICNAYQAPRPGIGCEGLWSLGMCQKHTTRCIPCKEKPPRFGIPRLPSAQQGNASGEICKGRASGQSQRRAYRSTAAEQCSVKKRPTVEEPVNGLNPPPPSRTVLFCFCLENRKTKISQQFF